MQSRFGMSLRILLVVSFLIIGGIHWIYGKAAWVAGYVIATQQPFFWLMMALVFGFAFLWKKYNDKIAGGRFAVSREGDVTWLETVTHFISGLAVCFAFYSLFIFTTTGVGDTCKFNVQVVGGSWYEEYTEERTDSTGTYCDDYHPDRYEILFSNGVTKSIERRHYYRLVELFGNEEEDAGHWNYGQCSIGDGRKFDTRFIPGQSPELYASYEEYVVNYVKGSRNLHKKSLGLTEGYDDLLRQIPPQREHPAGIGPWDSDRVVVAGVDVPGLWLERVESELDKLNGSLGPSKEVNVIVYLVNSTDPSFRYALEAYWINGAKNQLTVIVGSTSFPKIEWVEVIDFWCQDSSEIGYDIRDQLQSVSLDTLIFVPMIQREVERSWQRKEMASLEYLARDITLPWGAWLINLCLIVLLNLFFAFITKNFE